MPYTIENGFVKIPEPEFREMLEQFDALKEAQEDAYDLATAQEALKRDEECFPGEMVFALINGGNPVRIYREYRGLTQQVLADTVGVSKTTISEIENGRKTGSVKTLAGIAKALEVDIDDLV